MKKQLNKTQIETRIRMIKKSMIADERMIETAKTIDILADSAARASERMPKWREYLAKFEAELIGLE